MKKVLVISGHTDLSKSVANKTILATVGKDLPEAKIVKLDELYPDFNINIEAEQEKLLWADIIVFEYPIFWYSAPSLLHRYLEEVFQHGFSHGHTGDKLKGKTLIASFTTGAPEYMYSRDGMGITLDEMLLPLKATCNLTQMQFAGSVYTCGVSYGNRTEPALIKEQEEKCVNHAERLIQYIENL